MRFRSLARSILLVVMVPGCASTGVHRETLGPWGTMAPRLYRDRGTREEATILLEGPSWIAVFEHVKYLGGTEVSLIYPVEVVTPRLEPGRHVLRFPLMDRREWVPESTLLIFGFTGPVAVEDLLNLTIGVRHDQGSAAVAAELGRGFSTAFPGVRWEGFLYKMDMWSPGRLRE